MHCKSWWCAASVANDPVAHWEALDSRASLLRGAQRRPRRLAASCLDTNPPHSCATDAAPGEGPRWNQPGATSRQRRYDVHMSPLSLTLSSPPPPLSRSPFFRISASIVSSITLCNCHPHPAPPPSSTPRSAAPHTHTLQADAGQRTRRRRVPPSRHSRASWTTDLRPSRTSWHPR